MDRDTAVQISSLVRLHLSDSASFRLKEELETPLVDFDSWADGKECVAAYRVASATSELYLLLIQWSPRHASRFALIAYRSRGSAVVFEVHEVRGNYLRWTYVPRKQDGRNAERKARFDVLAPQRGLLFENSRVSIPIPHNPAEVEAFLLTMFLLADVRAEADDIPEEQEGPHQSNPTSPEDSTEPRYWLMALGPSAMYWDECRREGIACLGWDGIGNLSEYASRENFGLGRNDSLACWQFCHDMEPGDIIFSKRGTTDVVGHGTVTSGYRFDAAREAYKNVRDVDWHSNFPSGVRVRDRRLVMKTLTDVSDYPGLVDELKRAVGILQPPSDVKAEPTYSVDSILEDGCFLDRVELDGFYSRLRTKKNLVLQGPPGTGKTWLAKRLAYALIGHRDRERNLYCPIPSDALLRGFRPRLASDKRRARTNQGHLPSRHRICGDGSRQPIRRCHREINRGNPAQIFGELITLLEVDKRSEYEALELSYAASDGPRRVHVPDNLYVVGTMNIADRSLALVDLALRRRFAFITLKPRIDDAWHQWVTERLGVDAEAASDIQRRMAALNEAIGKSLGEQFCVGHSYVTPVEPPEDVNGWFRDVVETELAPLLEEYWFDDAGRAKQERDRLLDGW